MMADYVCGPDWHRDQRSFKPWAGTGRGSGSHIDAHGVAAGAGLGCSCLLLEVMYTTGLLLSAFIDWLGSPYRSTWMLGPHLASPAAIEFTAQSGTGCRRRGQPRTGPVTEPEALCPTQCARRELAAGPTWPMPQRKIILGPRPPTCRGSGGRTITPAKLAAELHGGVRAFSRRQANSKPEEPLTGAVLGGGMLSRPESG